MAIRIKRTKPTQLSVSFPGKAILRVVTFALIVLVSSAWIWMSWQKPQAGAEDPGSVLYLSLAVFAVLLICLYGWMKVVIFPQEIHIDLDNQRAEFRKKAGDFKKVYFHPDDIDSLHLRTTPEIASQLIPGFIAENFSEDTVRQSLPESHPLYAAKHLEFLLKNQEKVLLPNWSKVPTEDLEKVAQELRQFLRLKKAG